ncbi:MAG: hypothetical protein ACFFDN_10645 [Candidatus Hodarchaeota archaeon]
MTESEQLNREKYRFIIYHGHIHLLPINENSRDNDDLIESKIENLKIFYQNKKKEI